MPIFNNVLAGASGSTGGAAAGDYTIDRSLRFNSIDDSYLYFDPSGHGNRKVFTFSFWCKRSKLGTTQQVLYVRSGAGATGRIVFDSSDRLHVESEVSGVAGKKVTSAKFRDISAWQHFVIKWDAVNQNCDIYHNGVEITDFDTNTEPSNVDHYFGGDFGHYIGGWADTSNFDGYLAEIHNVNGSALDASSFGEPDANGVWQPKDCKDDLTYGTNGFYLKFADNSSNAALGTDSSGNNNTWTVYNLLADRPVSTTAITNVGATIDNTRTISVTAAGWQTLDNAVDSSDSSVSPSNNNTPGTITFSPALVGVTKVRAKTRFYGSGTAKLYNGSTQVHSVNHNNNNATQYYDIYDGPPIEITQYWQQMNSSAASDDFWALEINGAIVAANGNASSLTSTHPGQSITLTTTNDTNYSNLSAGDSVNKNAQISSIDSSNSQITVSAGSWNTGEVITRNSSSNCDSLLDSPTNYEADSGNNGGNYATLNPLESALTGLNTGNLNSGSSGAASWKICTSTMAVSSGKWYWEGFTTQTATESAGWQFGFCQISPSSLTTPYGTGKWSYQDGVVYYQGSSSNVSTTAVANDLLAYALDMDAGTCKLYVNNSLVHTFTGITGTITPFVGSYNTPTVTVNFGQRPFDASSVPTGYKALCTQNLDDPLIDDGSTAFDITTFSNNAQTSGSFTTTITPDLVITKRLDATSNWVWQDIVRGYGDNKSLHSNLNVAQTSTENITGVSGTTVSYGTNTNMYNSQEAWYWDAGNAANPTSVSVGSIRAASNVSSGNAFSAGWAGLNTGTWANTDSWDGLSAVSNNAKGYFSGTENLTGGSVISVANGSFSAGSSGSNGWVLRASTTVTIDFTVYPGITEIATTSSDSQTFADRTVVATNPTSGSSVVATGKCFWFSNASQMSVSCLGTVNNALALPSIASSYRANPSAGFSIVKGNFSNIGDGTLAHGLNAAPTFYIIRNIDSSSNWYVYTTAVDGTLDYAFLNSTNAFQASSRSLPTSSVIEYQSIATGDHIAYCWTPVEGYSAFGSYTANVSTNGPFVYTGFRPRWIMIKAASSAGDMTYASWLIVDTERETFNVSDAGVFANKTAAEGTRGDGSGTAGTWLDILSNGFKIRYQGTEVNGTSGQTYIYAAFAENPFKIARAR